jgi:hypothetical protein
MMSAEGTAHIKKTRRRAELRPGSEQATGLQILHHDAVDQIQGETCEADQELLQL